MGGTTADTTRTLEVLAWLHKVSDMYIFLTTNRRNDVSNAYLCLYASRTSS